MSENDGLGDLWELPPWWKVLTACGPLMAFALAVAAKGCL